MKRKLLLLIPLLYVFVFFIKCTDEELTEPVEFSGEIVKYRVQFTDKNNSRYSVDKPEKFLSQRAINRRLNQGIIITEEDLPVNQNYIDSLKLLGVQILNKSKWFNSVTVAINNSDILIELEKKSFVKSLARVTALKSSKSVLSNSIVIQDDISKSILANVFDYGNAQTQIEMLKGNYLHNLGYHGQGIYIALMDVGFYGADRYSAFDSLWNNNQILDTYNFVNKGISVFSGISHGMGVLSTIGANKPGYFIGTAPKAKFYLFCTEDPESEYPIEENNWVSAAEFADSAGVDVINTSLGYTTFDDPGLNYNYSDMDGTTTMISCAAGIASSKGIIVAVAAGNEGANSWKYIIAPADNEKVLSVGGVDSDRLYADFSSLGPTSDGRIKPDIAAMAKGTRYYKKDGSLGFSTGTSFAAPLITGLAACLWQAFPQYTSEEIIEAIKMSGSQHASPDFYLGYGIPDFEKAFQILETKK